VSTTCYVSAVNWFFSGVTGNPATVSPVINYMLVDDSSGNTLTSAWGGSIGVGPFPAATTDVLRTQAETGIQAVETDTPGLTFIWLY
jgi:hypothetical protein